MQNKVGDNIPSAEVEAQMIEQLTAIVAQLNTFGITLSKKERKRLLRARRDADPEVQRVHDLAVKHGISIQSIPRDGMLNDRALRSRLHPVTDLLRSALVVAQDTEGQAESEMWQAFLAYYGVLSSMADRIPELAVELKPVVRFMSNKRPAAKKPQAG